MENEIKCVETNNESTKNMMNECDKKNFEELFDAVIEFYFFMYMDEEIKDR